MRAFFNGLAMMGLIALVGCGSGDSDSVDYASAPIADTPVHSHEPPNGGELIEFTDDHSMHAEVCMDESTRDVTVYIYGANLDTPAVAEEIEFEIDKEGGEEVEIEAVAKPRDGEEGGASVFTIAGAGIPESAKDLHDFHWHMHIKVAGKEYEAELGHHDHGHEDHGHAHGDHDDHDHADHKEEGGPALGSPEGHGDDGHGHADGKDHDHDHDHKDGDKGEHKEGEHKEGEHKEGEHKEEK